MRSYGLKERASETRPGSMTEIGRDTAVRGTRSDYMDVEWRTEEARKYCDVLSWRVIQVQLA